LEACEMDGLAARIAELTPVSEHGQWQRHVAAAYISRALEGRKANGRWGTKSGFPVLYLGRPLASVVVEAYRHLVDPIEFDSPADRERFLASLQPRALVTCSLDVHNLLDLRPSGARARVGLTLQDLTSPTTDAAAYAKCQEVANVAHQLRYNGIVAPAATRLGETMALFMDLLPPLQLPVRVGESETWNRLPDDPRQPAKPALRVVKPKR
jgi:RES domain-containing protein